MRRCRKAAQRRLQLRAASTSAGGTSAPAQAYKRVRIVRTHQASKERLQELLPAALGEDKSGGAQAPSVFVSTRPVSEKPFLGFGGSFTEASAISLGALSQQLQEDVLHAYFDKESGLGYSLGRVPIGSCDFGVGNWTCGELTEGDAELKNFSLEPYRAGILPLLQRAQAIAGRPVALMASPWSPPPWMKTKNQFNGDGRLQPRWRQAWANHFVRFVEEMQALGIPIWAVSVQNEPEAAQSWESCLYTAHEERDFVRDFLGPSLEKAGLGHVKILIWDHNRDGMLERAALVYGDPAAAKYVWGVGYHWYGDARFEAWPPRHEVPYADRQRLESEIYELRACAGFENVRKVAELWPDKHLLFTEGCQELGGRALSSVMGHWKLGERYAMNIINDLNSGCEGWIDWNLCLDETGGPNHVGNLCVAPVICDKTSAKVHFQPSFWYIGHFSRYIQPGALRCTAGASRDALETTAFVNPDGSLVVVVMNQTSSDMSFWLKVDIHNTGELSAVQLMAPARSIQTFVLDEQELSCVQRLLEWVLPQKMLEAASALWSGLWKPRPPYQRLT
eukprot:TRINITY_DN62128_c0_g1_i1.p1 TRINITY_DN62128_c0_g1~~TRINITY_DN62128_c0_g1_i1.p1  ORF type:complete len:596 (+),score=96.87 TRINITY_DN62128_c0_g1_i1:101-1789(+)